MLVAQNALEDINVPKVDLQQPFDHVRAAALEAIKFDVDHRVLAIDERHLALNSLFKTTL